MATLDLYGISTRIVFWSDREKPLFLTPSGKTLTSRKAVLAAMEAIGGYSQVIRFLEITQSFVPFCDTDNKMMMLYNKSKRDFPSRRTSRRLRRARTRGRRSRTASGCKPRRRARGTFLKYFSNAWMHILNQLNFAQETTREEYQRQSEGDKEAKKGGTEQHKIGRERGTEENQKSA